MELRQKKLELFLDSNDIAPVVNSEDTAKQDNVKESDAKNADDKSLTSSKIIRKA